MANIRKYWSVVAVILMVAVWMAIRETAPTPVQAAGSAPVTVVNTPLPVIGTVGVNNFPATQPVSGTVNVGNFPATQPVSGTVGITGTPTVKVSANPEDLHPFVEECTAQFFVSGQATCTFDIPPGTHVVIETVSGEMQIRPPGTKPIDIDLQLCLGESGTDNFFHADFEGNSAVVGDIFTVHQQVRLYADSSCSVGKDAFVTIDTNDTNAAGIALFTVSGHLVSVP